MDKLLRDMDALCKMTAREREERYHESCRMARISEMLLSGDSIICSGAEIRFPIAGWEEQQVENEEMALIMARNDKESHLHGKHQDHMLFIIDEGDVIPEEIWSKVEVMVDELQDVVELFEYMDMIRDKDMNDILDLLEANISAYNTERG